MDRERDASTPPTLFFLPAAGAVLALKDGGGGGEISLAQDANWGRNFCTKERIKGSMIEVS